MGTEKSALPRSSFGTWMVSWSIWGFQRSLGIRDNGNSLESIGHPSCVLAGCKGLLVPHFNQAETDQPGQVIDTQPPLLR